MKHSGIKKPLVLFDIDYTLFNTDILKQSALQVFQLYDESLAALEEVSQIAEVGIFSEGDVIFQNEKLLQTKINTYFHHEVVHVVAKKYESMEGILHRYKNRKLFLVDDKLTVLHQAKSYDAAVTTIWVKRGKYAMSQEPIPGFSPDATVATLENLTGIINKSQ